MQNRKRILLIILSSILLVSNLQAQTPPARTWYQNDYGQNTTVKERWAEDAQGLKHGTYIKYFKDGEREILGYNNHDKANGQWEITVYSLLSLQQVKTITYVNFVNGVQHGLYKTVLGNTILVQGNYTIGEKTGYWKDDYDTEEKIYREGTYVNNIKDGTWKNLKCEEINKENNSAAHLLFPDKYILTPSSKLYKMETIKGYRTIFKNGEVLAVYDEMGENILLKQIAENEKSKKEKIEYQTQVKANEQQEEEFNLAMNKYQDTDNYYGDISLLQDYLKKYPSGLFIDEAKEAIKNKPDNDAFYFGNNYLKYEKEYPKGIHIGEVKKAIKQSVVADIDKFITLINKKLETGDATKSIELCEMVLRYKDEFHNSQYLPVVIYYSLALWSNDNPNKAVELIKPYKNTLINFSNGDRKFMDKYFEVYKLYKKPLKIEEDKDTYKLIHAL